VSQKGSGEAARLFGSRLAENGHVQRLPQAAREALGTTKAIEFLFAALRLRTTAAKGYKKSENAIAVIWKVLLVAGMRFRRLKAPELTS